MAPKSLYFFSMERNLLQVSRSVVFGVSKKVRRIWGFPKVRRIWGFSKVSRIWSFLTGNKGVFRTTGDRGRNFFGGLWIPHGYPKFSDSLQNRRCLPLKGIMLNYKDVSLFVRYDMSHHNRADNQGARQHAGDPS